MGNNTTPLVRRAGLGVSGIVLAVVFSVAGCGAPAPPPAPAAALPDMNQQAQLVMPFDLNSARVTTPTP